MKQKFSFSFYFQIILLQIICFVIFRLRITDAQISFENPCPDISVVRNFNVTKYAGVWFEIESYPSIIDEFDICVSLNYTVQTNDSLNVVSSWFNTSSKVHENIQGTARLINPALGAKLLVTFPPSPDVQSDLPDGNFWVVETDYSNYAIAYLCLPIGQGGSLQFVSYLGRERFPFKAGLEFVRKRIDSLGMNQTFLKSNDQHNCPSKTTP